MSKLSRRDFTKLGAAGVATALSASRVFGANERVRLGFIGIGNRGDQVLDAFLLQKDWRSRFGLRHLQQPYLDFASRKIGTSPKLHKNYHEVFDRKDVDAVVIRHASDHWHALQTIEALNAGKDVYCEKPLSLCVAEGRAMVEAARRDQTRHAGRPASPVVGPVPRSGGLRSQGRRLAMSRWCGRFTHSKRGSEGHRQSVQ